jgi:eukaryotic-like serine/threonine-protein kinase
MSDVLSEFDPVEELADSFLQRYRRGERPSISEYARQHPELADQIRELFPTLIVVEELGSVGSRAGPPAKLDTSSVPLQLGEYRIVREVGRGGMGVVYEAVQESLSRHVALKVLPFHGLMNPTHLERFRREARAAARLHHTNIVPVFGVGEESGVHYYAMQFIHGQGLDEVLQEVKRLRGRPADSPSVKDVTGSVATGLLSGQFAERPSAVCRAASGRAEKTTTATRPESEEVATPSLRAKPSHMSSEPETRYFRQVAQIGVQVAEALEYAHGEGVLHRDIKPSNLLLDVQGRTWVTDFGLAKADEAHEVTDPGDIVGTLCYMAPERFQGIADARSDVYGLGITLYELATLQAAFADSQRARLIEKVTHEEPRRPRKLDAKIPRDLETIVLKAIAKEPSQRFASAGALADDLRRFLADRPIQARRTSLGERAWRWCRRNPTIAALVSLAVAMSLAVVIVSVAWALQLRRDRDHAQQLQQRAMDAEREVKQKLWQSKRDQARAGRMSRQIGQRVGGLQALADAADLARDLNLSQEQFLELRNEAIACLALPDLHVTREWEGWPFDTHHVDFDGLLERYARVNRAGLISVRRVADDEEICRVNGMGGFGAVRLSPDGEFLIQESDGRLKLWKLEGPNPIPLLAVQDVTASAFSADSRQFAVGSAQGGVGVYNLASGQPIQQLKVSGPPGALAFHPHKQQLAIAQAASIQVRALDLDAVVAEFAQEWDPWPQVVWHPNGKTLASYGGRNIYLWNIPARKQVARFDALSDGVHLAFNHSGDLLASTGWDRRLRLWHPRTGRELFHTRADMTTLRFSPDDRWLAADYLGNKLRIWEVVASREYGTLVGDAVRGPTDYQTSSFCSDGRLLAVGMNDGFALWDLQRSKELAFIRADGPTHVLFEPWPSVALTPEASALITNGPLGLLRWPIERDPAVSERMRLGPPQPLPAAGSSRQLASSADGRVLACPQPWGADVLLAERPQQPTRLSPHEDVRYCAVSSDGRWVATGSHGPSALVKVWEASSGTHVKDLPTGGGAHVAFSPDGKWLATGGEAIRLWATGSWQQRFNFESRILVSMAFSPDSQVLAFETSYGIIRLVHPETGQDLAQLEDPDHDAASFMTFSPDAARLVVTASNSHSLRVWDLRALREQLAAMGLDWRRPPYDPAPEAASDLDVRVRLGNVFHRKIEAESLAVRDQHDCQTILQDMSQWGQADWSNGHQLFMHTTQKGGYAELNLPVPGTDKYQLNVYFTKAYDYGVVETSLDGERVGELFDGFNPVVVRSGKLEVGPLHLHEGDHRLRFTAVDRNPQSTSFAMGIDYIELRPVSE